MKIVVTRHASLIDVLIEDGKVHAGTPVISHADAEDVRDRDVIGVLPLPLAALARSLTTVDLRVPASLRGVELTAAQIRAYMSGYSTYRVDRM